MAIAISNQAAVMNENETNAGMTDSARTLARLTGGRDVAEELIEETWLRFVRHSPRFEADVQIGPWLFAVARNLAVSHFRSRTVEARVIGSLSLWPERRTESPFDTTARDEFERRLEAAVAALPPLLREALLLTAIEGLPPSEAAAGQRGRALRRRGSRSSAATGRRTLTRRPAQDHGTNKRAGCRSNPP